VRHRPSFPTFEANIKKRQKGFFQKYITVFCTLGITASCTLLVGTSENLFKSAVRVQVDFLTE